LADPVFALADAQIAIRQQSSATSGKREQPQPGIFRPMNYDTFDCRLSLSSTKAAKALRRKSTKKKTRSGNRAFAAIRAVTTIGAAFVAATTMAQAQFVIQPLNEAASKDTKIYISVPDSNFSSNLSIVSPDVGADFRSLLQFDLSSITIPSAEITSATVTLYCSGLGVSGGPANGGLVTLSPINTAWSESAADSNGATWNRFFGPTPTLSFDAPAASQTVTGAGFVTWDVTNLVKQWLSGTRANNGFIIQTAGTNMDIGFADTDSNPEVAGSAPRLSVVPEPGSVALIAAAGGTMCLARRRRHLSA